MGKFCRCGNEMMSPSQELGCLKCGAPCCPSCAYALESATYCARCAESFLDDTDLPLSLSAPAAPGGSRSAGSASLDRPTSGQRAKWLILVARDQPDLFAHLARAFARDDKVEITMDRRKDYSRNPPGMEDRLRTHGAAVIRRALA